MPRSMPALSHPSVHRAVTVLTAVAALGAAPTLVPAASGASDPMPRARAAHAAAAWSGTNPTDVGWAAQREVVVTPDGRRALVLADDGLRTLDLTQDPAPVTGHNASITGYQIAVRPRGGVSYVGNGNSIYVVRHGGARPTLARSLNGVLRGPARDLVVSADGKQLYVAYGSWTGKYGVRVYSIAKPTRPRQIAQFRSKPSPSALALDQRGDRLAVGHSLVGSVQLVDVRRPAKPRKLGKPVATPSGNKVSGMVFSRDRRTVLVGGSDFDKVHSVSWKRRKVLRTRDYSGLGTSGEGVSGLALDRSTGRLAVTFGGNRGNVTLLVASGSRLTAEETFTGLIYPTGPAFSSAGPTRGRAYLSSMHEFSDVPALFLGIVP